MTKDIETVKAGYYRLMAYAGMFGALSSLLKGGYITLYNGGFKFFGQPSFYVLKPFHDGEIRGYNDSSKLNWNHYFSI